MIFEPLERRRQPQPSDQQSHEADDHGRGDAALRGTPYEEGRDALRPDARARPLTDAQASQATWYNRSRWTALPRSTASSPTAPSPPWTAPAWGRDASYWTARDAEDRASIEVDETFYATMARRGQQNGAPNPVGTAIARLAASQVGTVNTLNRGDGAKFGWKRIQRFYQVALDDPSTLDKDEGDAFAKHQQSNLRRTGKTASGAWSWCGIFSVWAVRSVSGQGHWATNGSGEQGYALRGNKKADLRDSVAHRSVVERVDYDEAGDVTRIHSVDGMQHYQTIERRDRAAGEVVNWLETTPR